MLVHLGMLRSVGSLLGAEQRPWHRVLPVCGLPPRDVLIVVLCARPRQPVIREERANVALEAVVRHRPQAPRLLEATDRQVDFLRAKVLKRERCAALAAKPATRYVGGVEIGRLT